MDYKILDIGYQAPEKKTILVIDDESALQSLMFDTFVDDFKVVAAHNGREGLEKAEGLVPDLILLDVMMPDINGLEVLEHLQAGAKTRTIPVIVTSAKGFDPAMIYGVRQEPNVAGFMAKPFHVSEIRAAVRAALAKKPS